MFMAAQQRSRRAGIGVAVFDGAGSL